MSFAFCALFVCRLQILALVFFGQKLPAQSAETFHRKVLTFSLAERQIVIFK